MEEEMKFGQDIKCPICKSNELKVWVIKEKPLQFCLLCTKCQQVSQEILVIKDQTGISKFEKFINVHEVEHVEKH